MDIKHPHHTVDNIVTARYNKRFIFLLVSLCTFLFGALFIPPAFSKYLSPIIILQFTFAGLLLFRNHNRRIYRGIVFMVMLLLMQEVLKLASASSRTATLIADVTYLLYFIFMTFEVFRQILLARRVDINMVAGAFCGFLMLGILGSLIMTIIELSDPGAFSGIRTQDFNEAFQDLIYYSFVSLLTIGYGDILPVTSTARKASLMLGILGYFYNIFVIGVTISKFMIQRTTNNK
ncbi:MAG: hypothetical protein H6551_05375 [Chitinophagales bacterium]|nr:hypothetical protein [Chitinophagaceae bacterium]MCB9064560.1 hypothetical protein [Chitinophagales bacterium]